jgi:hypothetical protein
MSLVMMVTVSERLESLNRFLASLAEHQPGHVVMVHMQGDDRRSEIEWPGSLDSGIQMHTRARLGCHAARVKLLQEVGPQSSRQTYVNVDDDVELLPDTRWAPAIEKATEPGVGFVLTGWVRHENALEKARAIAAHEFVPQVMVYQGGGMAYDEGTASLMRDLPAVPARYDDIWPLTAYLSGRRNYRYRGSLALHRTLQKGGMQGYMRAEPRPLLCERWVNYRYLPGQRVGDDYAIPADADLKPAVREVHRQQRAAMGWS